MLLVLILIFVLFSGILWLFYQLFQSSKETATSGPSQKERKMLAYTSKLVREGNVSKAAGILEANFRISEATSLLERHGLLDEAVQVHLRQKEAEQGAYLYARHQQWEKALAIFERCDKTLQVAQCYYELGKLQKAAETFEKGAYLAEAAACYEKCGLQLKAGKVYQAMNKPAKTLMAYMLHMNKTGDTNPLQFSSTELTLFEEHILGGNLDVSVIDVLAKSKRLPKVVKSLSRERKEKTAVELLTKASIDLSSDLISDPPNEREDVIYLANILQKANKHLVAGKLYERVEAFAFAAQAFELAGEAERAAHCRNRHKIEEKRYVDSQARSNQRFALMDIKTEIVHQQQEEATQILRSNTINEERKVAKHAEDESIKQTLRDKDQLRVKTANVLDVLSHIPLFKNFDHGLLEKVSMLGRLTQFMQGDIVTSNFSEDRRLWLILKGEVECLGPSKRPWHSKAFVVGQTFGLSDWFDTFCPPINYVARTHCELWLISLTQVQILANQDAQAKIKLSENYTELMQGFLTFLHNNNRLIKTSNLA